jgi:hypothetical protein
VICLTVFVNEPEVRRSMLILLAARRILRKFSLGFWSSWSRDVEELAQCDQSGRAQVKCVCAHWPDATSQRIRQSYIVLL